MGGRRAGGAVGVSGGGVVVGEEGVARVVAPESGRVTSFIS